MTPPISARTTFSWTNQHKISLTIGSVGVALTILGVAGIILAPMRLPINPWIGKSFIILGFTAGSAVFLGCFVVYREEKLKVETLLPSSISPLSSTSKCTPKTRTILTLQRALAEKMDEEEAIDEQQVTKDLEQDFALNMVQAVISQNAEKGIALHSPKTTIYTQIPKFQLLKEKRLNFNIGVSHNHKPNFLLTQEFRFKNFTAFVAGVFADQLLDRQHSQMLKNHLFPKLITCFDHISKKAANLDIVCTAALIATFEEIHNLYNFQEHGIEGTIALIVANKAYIIGTGAGNARTIYFNKENENAYLLTPQTFTGPFPLVLQTLAPNSLLVLTENKTLSTKNVGEFIVKTEGKQILQADEIAESLNKSSYKYSKDNSSFLVIRAPKIF